MKNGIEKLLAALLFVCFQLPAHAAETTEWRLLGPAFSWHADKTGSLVDKPAHTKTGCTYLGETLLPSGLREIHMSCRDTIVPESRTAWSETNPAIGVERISRDELDLSATRVFGQVVRDSYGAWGAMAGAGMTWQLASSESFSLDAGFAGGLWYRTTSVMRAETRRAGVHTPGGRSYRPREGEAYVHRETRLERRLVPFVLPLLTVTHRASGLAVNVSVLPKTSIHGRLVVPTTTVMVQTSFPLPL